MLEDRRCMTGSASRMLLDTPFTVRIMSRRRKQANPRPLKVFEGQVGPDDGCTDITSHFEDDLEDEAVDDLDALAPLVIDTSISTKDPFEEISSQLFREQNQPTESGATSPSSESSSLSPRQSGFIWQNVSSRHQKKDEKIHPLSGINGENRYMCPVCQQVLGSSHDLTVHIRSHNSSSATQMNTCMICSKTLSSQSSLDRHMLVHSGERPFKCKICKMAFTTNGNMHRHTRIHTKEETESFTGCRGMGRRGGRGNWRSRAPSISSKACKAEAIVSNEACSNKSLPPLSTGHQQAVDSSKDALQEIPSNEHIFSLKAEEHVSPLQCQLESSSSFQREETQDVTDQEVEETLKEKEGLTLYCSVCGKGFLSKVGLERHLLTHPKFAVNRQPCDLSFRMPRSLHMHKLMAHDKLKNYDDDMTEKSLEKQPPVTLGFHDISFIDFSVEKFSLIAKARCEKISRKSSSQYHNFSCNICSKAFPCKSSLILHEYCHIPEKRTHCLVCGCEFLNNTALCIHNVKHASDDAAELFFSNFIENPNVQENMSQQNFLAHFDLISKEDSCDVKNVQDKLRCNELAENKEYFNKLAKFYPISMSTQNDTKAGSYNESTANCDIQENKSATEESVPHHISLTPPSQLDADKHTAAELLVSSQCSPLSSLSPSVSTVSPAPAGAPLNVHVSSLSVSSSSTPSTSDSGSVDLHGKKLKGMFHCKYCDLVFSNCRALKGHTRTHLGLSPYRCNLCSYSSADKSTLIRHLRTHNGERPFQCLICDFAFTTKANCERHVRKKHNKTRKEDIEKSIGYNKYVSDTHSNIDSFHSPDTICKYCGIDFKFFRALKHHLRSHSSCRQKPFMCQLCHVGFSTKANSVRHIQKQHTNISHYQIEKYIHLNEPMDNGLRLSPNASQHGDDINNISDILSNGHVRTMSAPPAHSSAVTESSVVSASLYIKAEPLSNIDQPLDFSLKKSGNNRKSYRSFGILPDNNDQPIDLSLRREDNSDIIKESVQRSSVSEQKFPLSCQYCSLHFATLTSLNDHIAGHHQLLEQAVPSCHREDIKPQNFGRSSLPSVYHYLKPGKVFAKHKKRQKLSYAFQSDSDILERESPYSIGSDSGSDLASVNKILDATGANKLQAIFNNSDHMEDSDFMSGQCRFLNNRNWPYLKEPYNAHLFKESAGELNEQTVDADALDNKALAELFHQSFNGDSLDNMLMENTADLKYDQNENKSELVVKKKRNSYADSPNKLPCPHCPRTFPWTSSLNRHLLTHTGQKPYKCPRCPVTFSTKSNRERHLIRKHGVNMLDPASRQTMDRPFKCHLCVFSSFATKDNLAKHYKERHPDTAMPDNLSDVDLSLITDKAADCEKDNEETFFMDEISDILSDDYEDEKFFELNGAKSDLSDNQGQVVDCTPLLNCGSAERQINPERDNYNVDKITKCWKCGESFSSRKLLVRHLKEHSIDLPFKCYLCDASFSCRLECLQHKEKQHVTDWQILKEKNKVKSVIQFAERMDVIVDYKCHADQSKSGQLEHVDSATEDIKHDVTVNDYLQRKVYCSLCPKRFWSLQDLRRHMRSHTGERPFECSVCQKRFTLKHSMMRHRKKHQEFGSFSDDDDDDSLPADDIAAVNALVVQREYPAECSSQSSSPSIAKKTFFISSKENSRYHENLFTDASFESPGQDMLHNLLGVDASSVDKLLDSADSAARLLGVKVQEQK